MSTRRLGLYLSSLVLAILVLPVFADAGMASAANYATSEISLEAVLNPATNGVYEVELKLNSPQELKLGDTIVLGPRSVEPIKQFGLGWLTSASISEACSAEVSNGPGQYVCAGAAFVPVDAGVLTAGVTVSKTFGVGSENSAPAGDTVVPMVVTESGQQVAWIGVEDVTAPQTEVKFGITSLLNTLSGATLSLVNTVMSGILGFFNEALNFVFSYLIGPGIEALLAIRTYTDQFAAPIFPAWKIIRNLSNVFFILAIIGIGLGTIFRIGGWQTKDMLVRLIIGAIFINFSLVLAQTVLGVADTIQNQFLPANTGALRLIGEELMVRGKGLFSNFPGGSFGTFDTSVKLIFGFIVTFASFIAFIALWFFLLIRTIALWLLLMVSPLAYAGMALPVTRNLTRRWWSNFIKFAFMTPAVAFMINLTALIVQGQRGLQNGGYVRSSAGGAIGNLNDGVSTVMYTVVGQAVVIAFLFASIKAASWLGAESGGYVEKVANEGWRRAVSGSKAGLRAARTIGTGGQYENVKTDLQYRGYKMKSDYLKKVGDTFGPVDADGNKRGGFSKGMFNMLTGGKYYDAKLKEGKKLIEKQDSVLDNKAKDWRNSIMERRLTAEEYEKRSKQNELIHDHEKVIEGLETSTLIDSLVERVGKGKLDVPGNYAQWYAEFDKVVDNWGLDGLMKNLGVKDTNELVGLLAKQGMGEERLRGARQLINNFAIDKGRFDYLIDTDVKLDSKAMSAAYDEAKKKGTSFADEYTPPGGSVTIGQASRAVQVDFWENKDANQQGQLHKNVLFDLDPLQKYDAAGAAAGVAGAVAPPSSAPWLDEGNVVLGVNKNTIDYLTNYADPDSAAWLVRTLSSEKKKIMRYVLNDPAMWGKVKPDLDTASGGKADDIQKNLNAVL